MRRTVKALLRTLVLAVLAVGCGGTRPPGLPAVADAGPPATLGDLGPLPDVLPARVASSYPAYDVTFVMPYGAPERTFDMQVEPRATKLDVHLNIDTTGSFGGEIDALQGTLDTVIIPGLRARVPDLQMGVSRFGEFPIAPFGARTDQAYNLLTPITADLGRVMGAVQSLNRPLQNGGDDAEPWGEALYQIATGEGLTGLSAGNIAPYTAGRAAGLLGGAGFRPGAAHVVINVTDAPSHEPEDYGSAVPGAHSTAQAAAALRLIGARMIGIASGLPARAQEEAIAVATGAVAPAVNGQCTTGIGGTARPASGPSCPLVFDIQSDGTGLGSTLVDGILRFLDSLAFTEVHGQPTDDTHDFVHAIEAVSALLPDGGVPPGREDRLPAGAHDGIVDTFTAVPTRTLLTFRVHMRNVTMPAGEYPQLYFVHVTLVGDGLVIGQRTVRVIVPEGPKPDGGDGAATDAVLDLGAPDDAVISTDLGAAPTDAGADLGASDDAADAGLDESMDATAAD